MLAQAVTGTPGHVNTMAEAVGHFIAEIPREEMFEGDAYVTNDPWKGTGHLHDITMTSPSFLDGRLVGFFACTAHVVDVGGRGFGADGKSVYEEGIQIPIMKFAERGVVNQDLITDIARQCARAEPGHRRFLLARLLQRGRPSPPRRHVAGNRSRLTSIRSANSSSRGREAAMRERFRALPKGSWRNEVDDGRLRRADRACGG